MHKEFIKLKTLFNFKGVYMTQPLQAYIFRVSNYLLVCWYKGEERCLKLANYGFWQSFPIAYCLCVCRYLLCIVLELLFEFYVQYRLFGCRLKAMGFSDLSGEEGRGSLNSLKLGFSLGRLCAGFILARHCLHLTVILELERRQKASSVQPAHAFKDSSISE